MRRSTSTAYCGGYASRHRRRRLWIREYHLDGLRIDAIHAIFDDSDDIFAKLARLAQAAAGERSIVIFAENERHQVTMCCIRRRAVLNSTAFGMTISIMPVASQPRGP